MPSFVLPSPAPSPTFFAYAVIAGDTLEGIARRYGTTGRSIAYWNRATYPSLNPDAPAYRPDQIQVGWVLVLIPGETVDASELPTAPPSSRPSPTPAASRSPSASPSSGGTATGASVLLSHGPRNSGQIALTFDMGGRLDPAVQIMNWLIAHDVKATIFPTAQMGTTAIGRQVLALVRSHPELFALGNHTYDHPDLTKLTSSQVTSQLTRAEATIAPLAGRTTKPWFRPPFGAQNLAVRNAAGAAGWRYTVLWDVDTIDGREIVAAQVVLATGGLGPTTDDIVAKVTSRSQSGSIVLMHLGGYNTLGALPGILDAVSQLGLEPVTLDAWFPR